MPNQCKVIKTIRNDEVEAIKQYGETIRKFLPLFPDLPEVNPANNDENLNNLRDALNSFKNNMKETEGKIFDLNNPGEGEIPNLRVNTTYHIFDFDKSLNSLVDDANKVSAACKNYAGSATTEKVLLFLLNFLLAITVLGVCLHKKYSAEKTWFAHSDETKQNFRKFIKEIEKSKEECRTQLNSIVSSFTPNDDQTRVKEDDFRSEGQFRLYPNPVG